MIELLLTPLVAKVVTHYAGKALPLIDGRLAELFERMKDDPQVEQEADQLLKERIRENPDQAKALAVEVLKRPSDPAAPSPQLDAYWRILIGTLDGVEVFRPPLVALPGFFTGPDVVTVIDARLDQLSPTASDTVRPPYRSWDREDGASADRTAEPGIGFFGRNWALETGTPRVYLMPGAGADRDAKVAALNENFQSDAAPLQQLLDSAAPELVGVDPAELRQVSRINEKAVLVAPMAEDSRSQRIPIPGTDGVREMRAALEKLIAEHDRKVAEWRDAAGDWGSIAGDS